MSDWTDVCDAIVADLTANVAGLSGLPADRVHRYAPWDPEELVASTGERHLAVWPAGEAEVVEALVTNSYMSEQSYVVLVWEGAAEDAARARLDEAGAAALLELHNAVRARFAAASNFQLAGSDSVRPAATAFPETSSPVRWFAVRIRVSRAMEWT